jgi:triosephosphate isomerase
LGAQNLSGHEYGAYTGEISAKQLTPWNVTYAILGHSERRIYFDETDSAVNDKIKIALEHHITPIVCLGGDKKASRTNTATLVTKQLRATTKGLDKKHLEKIVYVYEPTWAISSMQKSQPATGEHAKELVEHIRKLLAKQMGKEASQEAMVLYGGTVNRTNAHEFSQFPEISGALVGFASLEPNGFFEVISEFHRESIHKQGST